MPGYICLCFVNYSVCGVLSWDQMDYNMEVGEQQPTLFWGLVGISLQYGLDDRQSLVICSPEGDPACKIPPFV